MTEPEGDDSWDVVFTKANPVLGGFEYLRAKFKGDQLGDVSHENLNHQVPFPTGGKLAAAVHVLTGE